MAKLIYDNRNYSSSRSYLSNGITFTADGYIITHGTVYNCTGIATEISTGTVTNLTGAQNTGAVPYLQILNSVETTIFLEPPTIQEYTGGIKYLKWDSEHSHPIWGRGYLLTINGTLNTESSDPSAYTNLGNILAPGPGDVSSNNKNYLFYVTRSGTSSNYSYTWNNKELNISTSGLINSDDYIPTSKTVYEAIANGFSTNDAMVFKGVLNSNVAQTTGVLNLVPSSGYSAGWTYKVAYAGTYAGLVCEVGDLVIAVLDAASNQSAVNNNHWLVIQNNIDILGVAKGGTGHSTWTKGGIIYADEQNSLSLLDNITTPNSGTSSGLLKLSVTSEGVISYSWITNKFVVANSTSGTSNSTKSTTGNNTAYINLLETNSKRTGFSIKTTGSGLQLTYTNGEITLLNTLSENVSTSLYIGENNDTKETHITSNGNTYLKLFEGNTRQHSYKILGAGSVSVASDSNGNITITGTDNDTWRPVLAHAVSQNGTVNATTTLASIDQDLSNPISLKFGEGLFIDSNGIIDIGWCEIDSDGKKTYTF